MIHTIPRVENTSTGNSSTRLHHGRLSVSAPRSYWGHFFGFSAVPWKKSLIFATVLNFVVPVVIRFFKLVRHVVVVHCCLFEICCFYPCTATTYDTNYVDLKMVSKLYQAVVQHCKLPGLGTSHQCNQESGAIYW
jgi:hypothetical protein